MSIKHAFLKNNVVVLVDTINEEDYSAHIREWDAIIKIEDIVPEPKVGWILNGNRLVSVPPEVQQKEQQLFGAGLALDLVNRMGTRNLQLASQGESVNVSSLLGSIGSIKSLIETGALKTARTAMTIYLPMFPAYSDIFQHGITSITTFLQSKGWDD